MAEAFIGQIELFAFGYAPRGWALCAGQLMAINQNQALFSVLGTTYGGNGRTTFALPDLRGRVPIGQGNGPGLTPRDLGSVFGNAAETLNVNQMPLHSHKLQVSNLADKTTNTDTPGPSVVLAKTLGADKGGNAFAVNIYAKDSAPNKAMAPASIGNSGGQPHDNMMPSLAASFCISLQGVFPSRS
jgi:microcystin-dependent protein